MDKLAIGGKNYNNIPRQMEVLGSGKYEFSTKSSVDNVEKSVSKKRERARIFKFTAIFSTSYQHFALHFSTYRHTRIKNLLFRYLSDLKSFYRF